MSRKTHTTGPSPNHSHTHTIVFLHGKGSDSNEFAVEFFESEATSARAPGQGRTLPDLFPTVRWVFPSAPLSRSERFESDESQWFDMWSVEDPDERVALQVEGLKTSIALIRDVVGMEAMRVPRDRIFLGGISQGFAAAVSAFLVGDMDLAGLTGFCSWMPTGALKVMGYELGQLDSNSSPQAPVFLGHSADDGVVPVENGRLLHDRLLRLGLEVEWHQYESGGHWIHEPDGVDHLVAFLDLHMGHGSNEK